MRLNVHSLVRFLPRHPWFVAVFLMARLMVPTDANAQSDFLAIAPAQLPNFAGIGIGGAPDYFGSNDYFVGGLPFGRVSWEERYVNVLGNYVTVNLLNDPNWRFGPAGLYRFGRSDVDDPVVNQLPDISDTIDLGAFVAYEVVNEWEPRDRFRIGVDVLQDVGGEHEGFVVSGTVSQWFPVFDYAALGIAIGTTYASSDYANTFFSVSEQSALATGLPKFTAGSGLRDARIGAVFVQPISESWMVGAGALYSHLIGDAANSPIVADRGSPNQFIFGIGAAYSW